MISSSLYYYLGEKKRKKIPVVSGRKLSATSACDLLYCSGKRKGVIQYYNVQNKRTVSQTLCVIFRIWAMHTVSTHAVPGSCPSCPVLWLALHLSQMRVAHGSEKQRRYTQSGMAPMPCPGDSSATTTTLHLGWLAEEH